MQTAAQKEGVRNRLAEAAMATYGELSPSNVTLLAKKSGVHYTSLARYLLYPEKRTGELRRRTLDAVALALDVNPEWIRDGQSQRQLSFWPKLLQPSAEIAEPNPDHQLGLVLTQVKTLAPPVRVLAYRAAVAAILEAVTNEGANLDGEAYRCLMQLDALRRPQVKLAAS